MGVITDRKPRFYSGVDADKASIPASGKAVNDLFFATDTGIPYRWDGANWKLIVPDDTISAGKLTTDSVTTDKIVALNVTTGKIALLAVDTAQLAALAVEESKIGALAVTNGKLGLLSVAAGNLQTDSVETIKIKDANVTLAKLADDAMGDFGHKLLHIRDQRAANTPGGTFTLGVWRTRVLNIVLTNEIAGSSLASNQITLPAGDYFILASAAGYFVSQHKTKLRNITDGSDILIGTSEMAAAATIQTNSFTRGRFTLGDEKDLELQHRCVGTKATDGFGTQTNIGVFEVYADVMIWKI